MNPAITVIVPIYNVEQYIYKSIESILSQTLNNIEIILVDDGSTDKSGDIADFYAKKDSRVKVIHKKNQGVSMARNLGLKLAAGEYVSFIDSDDWIDVDMLEKLYYEAIENNCDVVMCCFSREDIKNNKSVKIFHPFQSNTILLKNDINREICSQLLVNGYFTSSCDKIYRLSFLKKYKIKMSTNVKLREDYIFNMNVFNFADRVKYVPMPFYHYRDADNSAVKKYYKNLFEFDLRLYKKKKKYLKEWFGDDPKYLIAISYNFLMDVFHNIIQIYNKNNLDGIKNKWGNIYNIVNNFYTRQALLEYKEHINCKDKISLIKIKMIKNKQVLLLTFTAFFSNIISTNTKIRIKNFFGLRNESYF